MYSLLLPYLEAVSFTYKGEDAPCRGDKGYHVTWVFSNRFRSLFPYYYTFNVSFDAIQQHEHPYKSIDDTIPCRVVWVWRKRQPLVPKRPLLLQNMNLCQNFVTISCLPRYDTCPTHLNRLHLTKLIIREIYKLIPRPSTNPTNIQGLVLPDGLTRKISPFPFMNVSQNTLTARKNTWLGDSQPEWIPNAFSSELWEYSLGRPRSRCEDNIRMVLREIFWEYMD